MGKTATCVDVEQKKRGWRKGRSRINQRRRSKGGDQPQEGQNSGSDEAQEDEDHEEQGAGFHSHNENGHQHHDHHHHAGQSHSEKNGHPAAARQGLRWSGSAELDQDTSATASSSISPVREPPAQLDPLPHPHQQQGRYHVYPAPYQPHQQHLQMPPTSTSPSITPLHPFDPLALPRHSSTPMSELFMARSSTPSLPPHSLSPYPSALTAPPFLQFQDLGSALHQPFIYPQAYPLHRPPFSGIIPPGPTHNLYPHQQPPPQQQHGKPPAPPIQVSDSKFFIMVLSLAAAVLDCHDITCAVLGFAKMEVVRKSFFDLVHPADIEIIQKVFLAAVKLPPQNDFILLFRIRSKLGEFLWIEAKGVLEPVSGSAQSIIKLVGGLYHEKPFTDPPAEDN